MSTERRYAVLAAVGTDRPGLVQEISQTIHDSEGNLEDSRMAVLGGEFALIVLLSGPPSAIARLRERCAELERRLGLRVSLHETRAADAARGAAAYKLRVTGVDRPGIVLGISRILANRRINVASLESRVQNAPESGTPMFILSTEIQVPADVSAASLREELAAECDEQDLDFSLDPA